MEFDQAIAELDTLVATLERDDDERALMLLQLIDAIHRPGLELIVAGELEHPIARALLSMYDLAPLDERIQVEEALDEIRPYIESHGGELELLDVQDGVVHVRMSGACHGCAGSAMTLRRGIEEKLRERYEGFVEIVAHEPETPAGSNGAGGSPLLQIEQANGAGSSNGAGSPPLLQIEGLRRPVFEDAGALSDLPPGSMHAVDLGGSSILIANVGGEPYAFKNACPVNPDRPVPLHGGRLTGAVLVCPWHNCAYDARSGKRCDDMPEAPALAVVPVAVRDGVLKVAVNAA
ncbi:MAG: NifU family protein [Actinomycetota bacterium]|nr:NifU family protein [Actinomycetota bacterium]